MAKKKPKKPNPEYKLPKEVTLPPLRILAMDPGSRNFGISCVGIKNNKFVVLANASLMKPVDTLVDFEIAKETFLEEIRSWVKLFKPNAIIAERFQTRGNGGPLIELVSVMLGLIAGTYPKLPIKFITASTWKNAFNKRFQDELAKTYPGALKLDLKLVYESILTAPHPLDATLIGIYGLEYGMKNKLNYKISQIVKQVEKTSCLPLRKPRK